MAATAYVNVPFFPFGAAVAAADLLPMLPATLTAWPGRRRSPPRTITRSPAARPPVTSTRSLSPLPTRTDTRSATLPLPMRNTCAPSARTMTASRGTRSPADWRAAGRSTRTAEPIGQPGPVIAMRTSIMRERSSPTGTIARILLAFSCAAPCTVTACPAARWPASATGARATISTFSVSVRRTTSVPAATNSPSWRIRSATWPENGARIVARAIECRVLSAVARACSSSCLAMERRAAASSIWLFEAMPSGSALSRASCVSRSSAFAARREICASFSRS